MISRADKARKYAPWRTRMRTNLKMRRLRRFEQARDRLDLVAGIDRQARAQRIAAVERALAGEHLHRHHIAQHRHLAEFLALARYVRFDRERHVAASHRLICRGGMFWEYGQELSDLHHLVDVEDVLLEPADGGRIEAGEFLQASGLHVGRRDQRKLAVEF